MPVIVCPTCGTKLEIDASQIGEEVECESCQQVFRAQRDSDTSRGGKGRSDRDESDRPSKRRRSKYRRDDDDSELDEDYRPRTGREPPDSIGMGIASLVLGLVAILMALCCWPVGGVCAILSIIFGLLSLKTAGKGMGIAGIIMGGLSILLAVVMLLLGFGMGMFNAMNRPAPGPNPPQPVFRLK